MEDFLRHHWRDLAAVGWFIACWAVYIRYVQVVAHRRRSLTGAMTDWREAWMRQLLGRENRIVDSTVIANLERNVSFLASSALLIVAALLTTLAGTEQAINLLASIPFTSPSSREVWEAKLLLLVVMFIYAFFQFTWSMRQYSFLSVLVAGAPPPVKGTPPPAQEEFVRHGAEVATLAAFAFNQGLRAYYFALAVLAWLLSPVAFMIATTVVVWVLYRREFHSPATRALERALAGCR